MKISKILIIIALLMLLLWVIGFFLFNIGMMVHLFLLIAVVLFIIRVVRDK
ncbi:lmo0937 family membrane protein [Arenibacter sp. P308M17]|uniref:lmo0937 family membrane protein n=1 Tax=unclassified Arenibacter TaxID=2615047 RepID=UPI000E355B47|nr:lmo0937 family membrane protein [Arenibacter sp. A80]RFT55597.1 lmo0937 family membrane protein [Arenibacter sp. P308M17]